MTPLTTEMFSDEVWSSSGAGHFGRRGPARGRALLLALDMEDTEKVTVQVDAKKDLRG